MMKDEAHFTEIAKKWLRYFCIGAKISDLLLVD